MIMPHDGYIVEYFV